jgi:peptide/nickel transport system substrate-binding protein
VTYTVGVATAGGPDLALLSAMTVEHGGCAVKQMRACRTPVVAAGLAVLAAGLITGCSGTSPSSATSSILRIGTVGPIDSLNPYVAINDQSFVAFAEEYPRLVQYGPPGITLQGEWAKSWTVSKNGLVWTFHLWPGGKWSDGVPMTAHDAAWTGNISLKYDTGPTADYAAALYGIKSFSAPDNNTLVVTYDQPVGNVLANLEELYILPEHVWDKYLGNNGGDLRTFLPQDHLPTVGGGPYYISQFQEFGTTVFRRNPYYFGPKSHAAAVTLTYFTNGTSLVEEFEHGGLDFVDEVPFSAAKVVQQNPAYHVQVSPGADIADITFNSNPAKPKNRELLSPLVKKAFEYATPRQQIANVVFGGFAEPWANDISAQSVSAGWVDPAIKPLPYDPAKGNQILNSLGYKMGRGGIRVVPATHGRYAQAAHPMSYGVIVPGDLDFNGTRQFLILQAAYKKIGVQLNEIPGGDAAQAYALETAPNGKYLNYDMATWFWSGYIDPSFVLSGLTTAEWDSIGDTGFNDPTYNRWFTEQESTVNQQKRRALIFSMEQFIYNERPYIQLVDEDLVTAHDSQWTGFLPDLGAYCTCYYTSPHGS